MVAATFPAMAVYFSMPNLSPRLFTQPQTYFYESFAAPLSADVWLVFGFTSDDPALCRVYAVSTKGDPTEELENCHFALPNGTTTASTLPGGRSVVTAKSTGKVGGRTFYFHARPSDFN